MERSKSASASPRICVLLATFNSESYIVEQLESLSAQQLLPMEILIHDDISTDATATHISEWLKQKESAIENRPFPITVRRIQAPCNGGFVRAFFRLIESASTDFDYYAFCDHDDYWHPDKLVRAVRALETVPNEEPALYFSRLQITDSQLHPQGLSPVPKRCGLGNAIVENQVTGCTAVINRAMLCGLQAKMPRPRFVSAHDWWLYLYACAFGRVIYDAKPTISYRQHARNELGAQVHFWKILQMRLNRARNKKWLKRRPRLIVREFLRCYSPTLDSQSREMLQQYLNPRKKVLARLRYAMHNPLWRQSILNSVVQRLLLAIGR